jgi:hypothetical protein
MHRGDSGSYRLVYVLGSISFLGRGSSLCYHVHTGSEVHEALFLGIKWPDREDGHRFNLLPILRMCGTWSPFPFTCRGMMVRH